MKFDKGLRILISQSKDGIKIFKLLLGFLPIKTLFQANFSEYQKHDKFMKNEIESSLLLDNYVETIKQIKNKKEFYKFLKEE